MATGVLISDFDGTITETDFFEIVYRRLVPSDAPDYLSQWRAGTLTHFEAMSAYFAYVPPEPAALRQLIEATGPDAEFGASVERLRQAGWDLIVVSAGCRLYIDEVLAAAGVKVPVHSNPGRIVAGEGLRMELPRSSSPFFSAEVGVDKPAVVRDALSRYERVAFAGDGTLDVEPALLVPAELRFARRALAEQLERRGEGFRHFGRWSEIAAALVSLDR